MIYREFRPSASLARFVRCYWILEGESGPTDTPERVLPDGQTELIIHYGQPFQRFENGSPVSQNRSVFAAQIRSHIMLQPSGKSGIAAIRFLPFGAFPFLRRPMAELTDNLLSMHLLFGSEAARLEEQVAEVTCHENKVKVLEEFLLGRLRTYQDDPLLSRAVYNVQSQKTALTKDVLLKDIGIGLRQLERRFQKEIGLSPRSLSRGLRIWESGNIQSLTQLALECGYYDQAHFNNDFKDFAGISPKAFMLEKRQFADNFFLEN